MSIFNGIRVINFQQLSTPIGTLTHTSLWSMLVVRTGQLSDAIIRYTIDSTTDPLENPLTQPSAPTEESTLIVGNFIALNSNTYYWIKIKAWKSAYLPSQIFQTQCETIEF